MGQNGRSQDASSSAVPPPGKGDGALPRLENRAFLFCPKCCQTLCQELANGKCPQCKKRVVRKQRKDFVQLNEPKQTQSLRGLERSPWKREDTVTR